jgi:hypothetical protein
VRKLAKDCCKYGTENEKHDSNYPLASASLQFGTSYDILENERETLLGILRDQVIFWDISLTVFKSSFYGIQPYITVKYIMLLMFKLTLFTVALTYAYWIYW